MPTPLLDMKYKSYKTLVYRARRCKEAKVIIVNSNGHIETKPVEALAHGVVTQLTPDNMFPEM